MKKSHKQQQRLKFLAVWLTVTLNRRHILPAGVLGHTVAHVLVLSGAVEHHARDDLEREHKLVCKGFISLTVKKYSING